MRLTYTDLQNQFLRGIQNAGSSDSTLLNFFQLKEQERYQLILAELQNYTTQVPKTATTTASRQFNHYPPGIVTFESCTIDIGSEDIPLTVIHSQKEWDRLNRFSVANTSWPQFIFPRRDDFGLYPIPGGAYTLNFNANIRDRTLSIADYATGTISIANNSVEVVGVGTIFTAAMVGRWLEVTSATAPGKGTWYRIAAFTDTTHINLETSWVDIAASGVTYRIGQTPEIPEEGHGLLYIGPVADFFSEIRGDIKKATWFNNVFWTGDGTNSSRELDKASGGLLGLKKRYASRSNSAIIKRLPSGGGAVSVWDKLNATTIS